MIDPADISFVVQGPVQSIDGRSQEEGATERCLNSIRRWFPKSTIILSTWENQTIHCLDYDKLVVNQDPGSLNSGPAGTFNNVNRQIVSTSNGLQTVETKYAAKIRSDFYFEICPEFLGLYEKQSRFFESAMTKRSFLQPVCTCFHPTMIFRPHWISDWFHFGHTDDMRRLWEISLATRADAEWFKNRPLETGIFERLFSHTNPQAWTKYSPEQHIWINYQRAAGFANLPEHRNDALPTKLFEGHKRWAKHFIAVSRSEIGLKSKKYDVGAMPMDPLVSKVQALFLKHRMVFALSGYAILLGKTLWRVYEPHNRIRSNPTVTRILVYSGLRSLKKWFGRIVN